MPTFANRRGLHSHDMCIHAIDDADAVLCVIDKRYGGTYKGNFKASFPPQTFEVSGRRRNGKSKPVECTIGTDQLSITWCELIRGYALGKQVITFARARTLNEKETRRHNQFSASFKPAYADRNEVFDLLDWITKRPVDNWIVPFNSAVDFDEKLQVWLRGIGGTTAPPGGSSTPPPPSGGPSPLPTLGSGVGVPPITVIVEGPSDIPVVTAIASALSLPARVDVVPSYGKAHMSRDVRLFMRAFASSGALVFLADADTYAEETIDAARRAFPDRPRGQDGPSVHLCFAVPQIETWLWQALDPLQRAERRGLERAASWREGLDVALGVAALSQNIDRVAAELPDFAGFVRTLREAAREAVERGHALRGE